MYWRGRLILGLWLVLLASCGTAQPSSVADDPVLPAATALPTVAASVTALSTVTPLTATVALAPTATLPVIPTVTPIPALPATSVPEQTPTRTPGLDEEQFATLGSPDAPVTIYEFSDFGCPACRHYHLFTFPTLKQEYIDTGLVYYVYKDYPVVSRHGGLAAQAAECAGEQGMYWEMHHQLFLDPAEWDASQDAAYATFRQYAQALEMDAEALGACVAEGRYQADVDRDVEEALEIGWFGTPTFFINRLMLSGAMPPETFRNVIEDILSEQPDNS